MTVKGIKRLVYNKGKKCNIHSLKKYKGMEPTFKLIAFYSKRKEKNIIFFNNQNDKLL